MPMAEKAPTMASSSYSGGGGGATGLAPPIGLGESSSNEEQGVGPVAGRSNRRDGTNAALDDSWDPQIIAEGGQPVASGGGGGGSTRHITSTAGGDRPSAAQTAAAAAALSAAAGGPAAPSADVGVEVSPTHESKHDESLLSTSRGSAEEAAAAEQAMKRQAQSPLLACVDEASVLFREKMNCEYFEERQPSPHKRRHGGDDSDVTSLTPSQKQKQQKQKQMDRWYAEQSSPTQEFRCNPPTVALRMIFPPSLLHRHHRYHHHPYHPRSRRPPIAWNSCSNQAALRDWRNQTFPRSRPPSEYHPERTAQYRRLG
mmetsp:Transcript_20798/g.46427  ORF Transcript_20798/g.46427 Transcript_20798/m.46427 type:complete len:314 (-) Transcript_20798:599-1540(-)